MQGYWKTSELEGDNAAYLESLYAAYLEDPASIDATWKTYFDSLTGSDKGPDSEENHAEIRAAFIEMAKHPQQGAAPSGDSAADAYRKKGHLLAKIDPLNLLKLPSPEAVGLDPNLSQFKALYSGSIGYEFMYTEDDKAREWLCERIENPPKLTLDTKKWLLQQLVAADGLEKYLGTQYVGQKRFSLEGGDAFIPMMNAIIEQSGGFGVKEIVIGMAHRGRLNFLVNVMGKPPKDLFAEFEGKYEYKLIAGDVKYHNGYSSDIEIKGQHVHLSLAFNPSHLEIVSPVVEGSVRARQVRRENNYNEAMAVQVHGDAAFSGQGCIYESLNMADTHGYGNGGSIHIVINNQVGFTAGAMDTRSTRYCTDIAKMVAAPVFHVNGDDPEAVWLVSRLAAEYRYLFKRDVFIDLVCYRRHGHNESDEPNGTQPLLYQVIKTLPAPARVYANRLIAEKSIDENVYTAMQKAYRDALGVGTPVIPLLEPQHANRWEAFENKSWRETYQATLPQAELVALAETLNAIPAGFHLQAQVEKTLKDRAKMTAGELPLNWGYAEILAYATLVANNVAVRLSGEDSGRGTFSQRHAVLKDQLTQENYIPLNHVSQDQAVFTVIDSVLSEEAVMGFEYGYAGSCADGLTLWEAQYGDFANGAQVIIDQFISAGEEKWGRLNGLTLLLPHGQEGEGPEHASARLERFLQLCANDNMQVCAPTTPAQIYHLLRRQVLRPYRKPLIIMTPKSLLRHPLVTSSLNDLASGSFQSVLPELDQLDSQNLKRVIFCQGRVYYDLLQKRREQKITDIAIIRVEQMYPFPDLEIKAVLETYKNVKDFVWCQEEPKNQGAWCKLRDDFADLNITCHYVGRKAYASPAVGYAGLFKAEQQGLVAEALS